MSDWAAPRAFRSAPPRSARDSPARGRTPPGLRASLAPPRLPGRVGRGDGARRRPNARAREAPSPASLLARVSRDRLGALLDADRSLLRRRAGRLRPAPRSRPDPVPAATFTHPPRPSPGPAAPPSRPSLEPAAHPPRAREPSSPARETLARVTPPAHFAPTSRRSVPLSSRRPSPHTSIPPRLHPVSPSPPSSIARTTSIVAPGGSEQDASRGPGVGEG